ncbi:transposase [Synechococcus sp. CBW1108]|uniref:transposase n=1 Tax=Synechococcus sp. CBW1108 TaxID=1353147 RepID=UPI00351C862D
MEGTTAGALIPEIVRRGFQDLLEAEVSALTGAQLHERCPDQRSTHRNGYRQRLLTTQVGDISLADPPGSPGELPPEAPTDPYVTLSRHTAPVIQPLPAHRANGQTGQGAVGQSASGAHGCGDAYAAVVGASAAARRSAPDLGS